MKQSDKFGRRPWWRGPRTVAPAGSEEGGALYEFAMVLPLLATMLVAVIFGGITFFNYVELASAVESGGRTLANGRLEGTNACSQANTAITNSVGNLSSSQVVTGTVTFAGSSSCSSILQQYDTGVVSAVYPCNLPIPFTKFNLCPMANGVQITANFSGAPTLVSCPYAYCIGATTYVSIE